MRKKHETCGFTAFLRPPACQPSLYRVIKSTTLFDQRRISFRHVRQVLLLLFLVSQTAGGSRGVLVHAGHQEFPKNRQPSLAVFFRLTLLKPALQPHPKLLPLTIF
jgi:hypothetical protein